MPPKRRSVRNNRRETTPPVIETTEQIIERRVNEAIALYEANRNKDNGTNNSGTAPSNSETPSNTQQGCSYKTFQACKPTTYTGAEGAIGLIHWIEKMESVLDISNCANNNMVRFATCTLADKALTWWNAQVQIIGRSTALSMSWEALKQMMMEEFCSPNEVQKLETELWNIQMTGADITGYTTRFQELARLVPHMVTPEKERIKRYIRGLAPQIRGMVMSSKPATFRSAVDLAQSLTDDAILVGTLKTTTGKSEPHTANTGDSGHNKRKWNNDGNDRQGQQNRSVGNTRAYAAIANTETKGYQGKRPKCGKCERHHEGECSRCGRCSQWGHQAHVCKANLPTRTNGCFECGEPGHYKSQCPQLINTNNNANNNNNRAANTGNARGRAYIIGGNDAQPDPNPTLGTF